MSQPQKAQQKTSACCHLIQCSIFLVFVTLAFLPLIYHLGSHVPHQDIPHSLDEVFLREEYQNITTKLNKKSYKRTIVNGELESGLFQYLQHYADKRAQKGKTVIFRSDSSNSLQVAFKLIRQTKDYLEDQLKLDPIQKKTQWIFAIQEGQIPIEEIQAIAKKHPQHRIIIGTTNKKKIKGFKSIKFPDLTVEMLRQVLAKQFFISDQQAIILTKFYDTVPKIFENLDHLSYTHEKHLGPFFYRCDRLPKKIQKVLQKLCLQGAAVVKNDDPTYEEAGVIVHKNQAYWSDRKSRLNFELNKMIQCQDTVVPQSVIQDIQKQAEKAQQQAEKKQKKVKKVKKSKVNEQAPNIQQQIEQPVKKAGKKKIKKTQKPKK